MTFEEYLAASWSSHAERAVDVANGFATGYKLIAESNHISQFANLVSHVYGEHLGQFQSGVKLIERLKSHRNATDKVRNELAVFGAILQISENQDYAIDDFSDSEKVRILSIAACSSAGAGHSAIAVEFFERATHLSGQLPSEDPANRSMAVGSNNLAASFEEKPELSAVEKDLMLKAAQQARKYWAIAGAWLQIERAEYLLARCYLKAGDILNGIKHGNLCLTICEQNLAPPLEFFFAYEAIAMVEKNMNQPLRSLPQMQKYFELLSDEDKIWCRQSFEKLKI